MKTAASIDAQMTEDFKRHNWRAFHECPPTGHHSYVYRYLDATGALIYVGMTSNAAKRAKAHYPDSDWWSWVYSVEYTRCRNRDAAFKLETKVRKEEKPVFQFTHGYADLVARMDAKYGNRVLGIPPDDEHTYEAWCSRKPD